jgi:hypothetical protein
VPASELSQPKELSQPPSEPLPMPLPITQVDNKNPESVALAEARRSGKRVKIVSARTETTASYANPTGTITTEVSSGPVRVKKGKDWAPIDATLQFTADGVAPKAALGQTRLSKGGEKGSVLAATGDAGKRVSFIAEHAPPTPTLSADTATYSDVAQDQNLVVKATPTGFESFVVLKTRPEQPLVISVPLGLDGLVVRKEQSGDR